MKIDVPVTVYMNGQRVAEATSVEIHDAVAAAHRDDATAELVRDFADIMHNKTLARRAWAAMTPQQREYWREMERKSQAKAVAPNRKQRRSDARGRR